MDGRSEGLSRRTFLARGAALTAVGGLLPAALAACASSGGGGQAATNPIKTTGASLENQTVSLWSWTGTPPYSPVFKDAGARFAAAHSGSKLAPNYIAYADFLTKLKTALLGGSPPDLAQMPWAGGFRELVQSKSLRPVDDILASGPSTSYSTVTDSLKFDGQTWAVPLDVNTLSCAYNMDLFEQHGVQVPKTIDGLLAACQTFKSAGVLPFVGDFGDLFPCADLWFSYVAYTDPSDRAIFQADAKQIGWDDPRFLHAAEMVEQLMPIMPKNAASATGLPVIQQFTSGQAAMFYEIGNFSTPTLDSMIKGKFKYSAFPMPPADASKTPRAIGGVASMFSIPVKAKHIDGAAAILNLLRDPTGTADLVKNGLIPLASGAPTTSSATLFAKFTELQKNAATRVIYTTPVINALQNSVQQMIDGKAKAKDVVSAMVKAAKSS